MTTLHFRKYPRLATIGFLERVADTLRASTNDIVEEKLPRHIAHLVRELERAQSPVEADDLKGQDRTYGSARYY